MKMSIWQRLNTTLAILVGLLLLASGLAWWIQHVYADATNQKAQLNGINYRIHGDLLRMSAALQAIIENPKSDHHRNLLRETETDILAALKDFQSAAANQPELAQAIQNLQDLWRAEQQFHGKSLELLKADPATTAAVQPTNRVESATDAATTSKRSSINPDSPAAKYYEANHSALDTRREQSFSELRRQIRTVTETGDLRARTTSYVCLAGIILSLLGAMWVSRTQSTTVTVPLNQLVHSLEQMRGGDFTHRVTLDRQDEFGILGDGLNRLADDLSVLVGQVQRSGIQVNMTATEIAATAKEQQSTTNEIAATTAEIGATSKEISATSRELDQTMNEVRQVAEATGQLANSGQNAISRMEGTMRQIMEASGTITAKLAVMSDKTANIVSVVTTITKVADQTNLLSLNAAIEAEKAGEYGLGFAVVAMEIRRLADQTAVATYDIERMVKEMQTAVAAGVMGMDKYSEEVRRGVGEMSQVSVQLGQIMQQVQTLTPRIQTVNEGMHAQATGAQQISETLGQLSEAAGQAAETLRQTNVVIEQLNEAARGLQTSVARFKLGDQ